VGKYLYQAIPPIFSMRSNWMKSSDSLKMMGTRRSNEPGMMNRLRHLWQKAIRWGICGNKVFLMELILNETYCFFIGGAFRKGKELSQAHQEIVSNFL
jgi:hypothetical protein